MAREVSYKKRGDFRMNKKIRDVIHSYQQRLNHREQRVQPYRERYNKDLYNLNEREYVDFKVLETEIGIYKNFIYYLEYTTNQEYNKTL
jgi:hypothetical protein